MCVPELIQINPEDVLNPEAMGSKDKFWFNKPGEEHLYLFKYGRENTGEVWAEKVACGIAKKMGIPCAEVNLASFQGVTGTASKIFLSSDEILMHGNELMSLVVEGYEEDKAFHQSEHTLDRIIRFWVQRQHILIPSGWEIPIENPTAAHLMAGYLVLDGLIGNTDRHHENWGLIATFQHDNDDNQEVIFRIAPSFDHASSLGRESTDERKQRINVSPSSMRNYVLRGRTPIYLMSTDASGAAPIEVIRQGLREYPKLFGPWLQVVRDLNTEDLSSIFEMVPRGLISEVSKDFALQVMCQSQILMSRLG